MQCAAGLVPNQFREVEGFRNNALACEGRITVDHNAHHFAPFGILALTLFGANPADNHRINDLKMRRVSVQGQVHVIAVKLAIRRHTHVVFHIT